MFKINKEAFYKAGLCISYDKNEYCIYLKYIQIKLVDNHFEIVGASRKIIYFFKQELNEEELKNITEEEKKFLTEGLKLENLKIKNKKDLGDSYYEVSYFKDKDCFIFDGENIVKYSEYYSKIDYNIKALDLIPYYNKDKEKEIKEFVKVDWKLLKICEELGFSSIKPKLFNKGMLQFLKSEEEILLIMPMRY